MSSGEILQLIFSLGWLSILILIGKLMRAKIKLFQKLFLPASLIAGFLGLLLGPQALNVFSYIPEFLGLVPEGMYTTWGNLSGNLINIVFACVFLGTTIPNIKEIWNCAGPQLTYAWLVDSFQWILGLGLALFVLKPIWGIDPLIGTIVEVGWSGGHGTAGGMTELYNTLGFPEGGALATTSATVGLVCGILFGVAMINIACRKGYTEVITSPAELDQATLSGILPRGEERVTSKSVILKDSLEPTVFHLGLIGISIILGNFMLTYIKMIPRMTAVPLFPIAMIAALLVQLTLNALKKDYLVDRATVERIQGTALDYLVASAVACISIPVVVEYFVPLMILMVSVLVVMILSTWFLARVFFRDAWFERGIAEFGALTGVLAVGLLLLRIVDPDYKTQAPKAFAFERPLFSPFIGGGLITSLMPVLMVEWGTLPVIGLWVVIALALLAVAFLFKWIKLPGQSKGSVMR